MGLLFGVWPPGIEEELTDLACMLIDVAGGMNESVERHLRVKAAQLLEGRPGDVETLVSKVLSSLGSQTALSPIAEGRHLESNVIPAALERSSESVRSEDHVAKVDSGAEPSRQEALARVAGVMRAVIGGTNWGTARGISRTSENPNDGSAANTGQRPSTARFAPSRDVPAPRSALPVGERIERPPATATELTDSWEDIRAQILDALSINLVSRSRSSQASILWSGTRNRGDLLAEARYVDGEWRTDVAVSFTDEEGRADVRHAPAAGWRGESEGELVRWSPEDSPIELSEAVAAAVSFLRDILDLEPGQVSVSGTGR